MFSSGIASEKSNNYVDAVAYFTLAINIEANYYEAIFHRGNACREMNNYNQALMDFTKLLMLKNTAENYVNRARINLEMNDIKNVLSDLSKAIQLDSNSYDAYYNRALVYHDKLEFDSAISDLEKCVEIRPDNNDAKDKLVLLQKFMESKNDSLNDNTHEIQNISDNWIDDFRDTQIHVEHRKMTDSDILVASKIINDNGIKKVPNQPVAKINNDEQPKVSDNTISEKSNNKEVPVENQKQNVPNNSLASNYTIDNNSASQNNSKIELPNSISEKLEQRSLEKQSIFKNDTKMSNDVNLAANQKQENNSGTDIIKTDNPTIQQNNVDTKNLTQDKIGLQFAEKIESKEIPDKIIPDISLKSNDRSVSIVNKEISENETAKGSNQFQKTNTKLYSIQLGAFENEKNAMEFEQKVKNAVDYNINAYQSSGLFKIRTVDYQLNEALSIVRKIRQSGFTDAIIVESEN